MRTHRRRKTFVNTKAAGRNMLVHGVIVSQERVFVVSVWCRGGESAESVTRLQSFFC